jgi:hypothetical protein
MPRYHAHIRRQLGGRPRTAHCMGRRHAWVRHAHQSNEQLEKLEVKTSIIHNPGFLSQRYKLITPIDSIYPTRLLVCDDGRRLCTLFAFKQPAAIACDRLGATAWRSGRQGGPCTAREGDKRRGTRGFYRPTVPLSGASAGPIKFLYAGTPHCGAMILRRVQKAT